jgi:hypothetical protein
MTRQATSHGESNTQVPTHLMVSSGKALPFLWNSSHPAMSGMNSGLGMDDPRASSTRWAAWSQWVYASCGFSRPVCSLIGQTDRQAFHARSREVRTCPCPCPYPYPCSPRSVFAPFDFACTDPPTHRNNLFSNSISGDHAQLEGRSECSSHLGYDWSK